MKFDYLDMLCGDPLYLDGVGRVKSPKLRDILSANGIGAKIYNIYLNFLSWDKEQLLHYDKIMQYRGADKLGNSVIGVFDAVTLLKQTRELCRVVLSFFIVETPVWNEKERSFVIIDTEKNEPVGLINRNNFEDVRKSILNLNYIGLNEDSSPLVHSDEATRKLWERAQAHLKQQAGSRSGDDKPEYRLGNIISKLCVVHPSYNLLNVYDLTVFQLYDAFFQTGFIRSADLNERIFSNHGGKKFKFEDWLKPIFKNI